MRHLMSDIMCLTFPSRDKNETLLHRFRRVGQADGYQVVVGRLDHAEKDRAPLRVRERRVRRPRAAGESAPASLASRRPFAVGIGRYQSQSVVCGRNQSKSVANDID